jgi:hypothetical protein
MRRRLIRIASFAVVLIGALDQARHELLREFRSK